MVEKWKNCEKNEKIKILKKLKIAILRRFSGPGGSYPGGKNHLRCFLHSFAPSNE